MKDLWGFGKMSKTDINGTPHGILKLQSEFFEKKTDNMLYIRLETRKLNKNIDIEYGLATNFEIVAPQLDGYSYTLFTLFSKPERDYPVAIELSISEKEEVDDLDYSLDYICQSEDDFIQKLGEILSSENTIKVVKNLYSKSRIL
ncbi:hypothetical protein FO518_33055 [Priestia megaterium]|nr:hypothetical protein [Priestia megaterium]